MAGGWTRDGAVQEQIDASVDDAVKLARSQLPEGSGSSRCAECCQRSFKNEPFWVVRIEPHQFTF